MHMGTPHLPDMSHVNPDHMGTLCLPDLSHIYLGNKGTYDQGHLGTHHHGYIGSQNQDNIGSSYQSDTTSNHPGHISSQHATDSGDLMAMLRPLRRINTGREESSHAHQVHDGSQTAVPFRTAAENLNVRMEIPVPDSARLTRMKPYGNPRKRSSRPEK